VYDLSLAQIEDLTEAQERLGLVGFLVLALVLVVLGLVAFLYRQRWMESLEEKARETTNAKVADVSVELTTLFKAQLPLMQATERTLSALADRIEAANGNSQLMLPIVSEGRDYAKSASEEAAAAHIGVESRVVSIRKFALEQFGNQESKLNIIIENLGTQAEISHGVRAILKTIAEGQANEAAKYDSMIRENNERLQLLKAETTEQYSKLASKVLDFAVVASGTQPVETVASENGTPL
jgi:hypothetical protein